MTTKSKYQEFLREADWAATEKAEEYDQAICASDIDGFTDSLSFKAGAKWAILHSSVVKKLEDAISGAIDFVYHEHSEDERGWESMCCDCEHERILREALAELSALRESM